jgi:hypothetical protein
MESDAALKNDTFRTVAALEIDSPMVTLLCARAARRYRKWSFNSKTYFLLKY